MVNNFKKWYKVLGMFCALSLALVSGLALTACGASSGSSVSLDADAAGVNKEGFPITKEKITLSMFSKTNAGIAKDWNTVEGFKYLTEKTNIAWDVTAVDGSDVGTKLNLALSSGEYKDVLFGIGDADLTPQQIIKYGESGVFIPLEDLVKEFAPNLNKILTDQPSLKQAITAPDGHIYTLPYFPADADAVWAGQPLWFNGDWLTKLGVTEDQLPNTVDEFKDLLIKMKNTKLTDDQSSQIPLYDMNMKTASEWFMSAFGLISNTGWGNDNYVQADDNGKVQFNEVTENYKAYLKYMNDLFNNGLLQKDVYSAEDDGKRDNYILENKLGVYPQWWPTTYPKNDPEGQMKNLMFHPLTSEYSTTAVAPISDGVWPSAFEITKKCQNPIAAIRWVDYLYTEDGARLANFGPSQEEDSSRSLYHYETNANGEKVPVYNVSSDSEKENNRADYGFCSAVVCPSVSLNDFSSKFTTKEKMNESNDGVMLQNWVNEQTDKYWKAAGKVPFPTKFIDSKYLEVITRIKPDLETAINGDTAKFITGKLNVDSDWDAYVEKLKKIGYEEYTKAYQDAYDAFSKK